MNIRNIEKDDIREIMDIINKNYDEVMAKVHSFEVITKFKEHNTVENWDKQRQWKHIFVVESNGTVIATGALANFGDNVSPKYCLSNFFVEPQKQHTGVGKFLFQHILKFAVEKNIKTLHVPSSRTGLDFYRKMGFVIDSLQNDEADEITWMTRII